MVAGLGVLTALELLMRVKKNMSVRRDKIYTKETHQRVMTMAAAPDPAKQDEYKKIFSL